MGFWETVLGPKYQIASAISFLGMKGEPMAELPLVQKNLVYASDYNLDIVIPQLIGHKSHYKRTITQKTVDKYNLTVDSISSNEEDNSSFNANVDARYPAHNFISPDEDSILDVTPLPSGKVNTALNIANQILNELTSFTFEVVGTPYYENDGSLGITAGTRRASVNEATINITNFETLISFSYNVDERDPNDIYVYNFLETLSFTNINVAHYLCANIDMEVDGSSVLQNIYVDRVFYTLGIYTAGTILNIDSYAPNFLFTNSSLSDKDRNRLLGIYGADLEALQDISDNSNIRRLRVGFMISPTTMQYHERIVKYFFDYIDRFPLNITTFQTGLHPLISIPYSIGDFTVKIRMRASKEVLTGTFPKPSTFKEWKVYIRNSLSYADIYGTDLKNLYAVHILNVPEGTAGIIYPSNVSMHNQLTDLSESLPVTTVKTDLKSTIPPKESTSDRKPRRVIHAFCEEANISEALYDKLHDENDVVTGSVIKYKEAKRNIKKDPSIYEDYFYERSKFGDYERYDIYKRTGLNTYEKITITEGSLKYSDEYQKGASIAFKKRNEDFRLPLMYNDLARIDGKPYSYTEFSIIYNNSLCAYAYSVVKHKLKWYQRSNVSTIIIVLTTVIAIIVSVVTAGAAVPIATSVEAAIVTLVTAIIISMALSFVGDMIGGDLGMLFQLIGSVVIAIYTGNVDDSFDLLFALGDSALKYASYKLAEDTEKMAEEFNAFMKDINSKSKYVDSLLDGYSRSFDPQILIENIRNSDVGSLIGASGDDIESMMRDVLDNSWLQKELKSARVSDPYENIEIPKAVFDIDDSIYSFPQYGDESEFRI